MVSIPTINLVQTGANIVKLRKAGSVKSYAQIGLQISELNAVSQ